MKALVLGSGWERLAQTRMGPAGRSRQWMGVQFYGTTASSGARSALKAAPSPPA